MRPSPRLPAAATTIGARGPALAFLASGRFESAQAHEGLIGSGGGAEGQVDDLGPARGRAPLVPEVPLVGRAVGLEDPVRPHGGVGGRLADQPATKDPWPCGSAKTGSGPEYNQGSSSGGQVSTLAGIAFRLSPGGARSPGSRRDTSAFAPKLGAGSHIRVTGLAVGVHSPTGDPKRTWFGVTFEFALRRLLEPAQDIFQGELALVARLGSPQERDWRALTFSPQPVVIVGWKCGYTQPSGVSARSKDWTCPGRCL